MSVSVGPGCTVWTVMPRDPSRAIVSATIATPRFLTLKQTRRSPRDLMARCAVKDTRRSAWGIMRSAVPRNGDPPEFRNRVALPYYGGGHAVRHDVQVLDQPARRAAPRFRLARRAVGFGGDRR